MGRKRQLFFGIIFIFAILFPLTVFNLRCSSISLKFLPTISFEKPHSDNNPPVSEHVAHQRGAFPQFAYLISGSQGDGMKIRRTLQSVYHPQNFYVLHLDLKAHPTERANLSAYIRNDPFFQKIGNVLMIEDANLVTYRGPTMVAETLHGAAILLKNFKDWDWFINLSASDYPLVTQDELRYVFATVPPDLNFIEHTPDLGWKFGGRAKPIIIDTGLHQHDGHIMETQISRELPTKFNLYTGSAWAVLSRSFMEYTVMGWDNLPRLLLMYYTNFVSTPEGYFHTVICNNPEFRNKAVNHDMHYIAWDSPPRQHPLTLGVESFGNLTASGAPFARKFREDDPVLDLIDQKLLEGRQTGKCTPGGWCAFAGGGVDGQDGPCGRTIWMMPREFWVSRSIPRAGAMRLHWLIKGLLEEPRFRSQQCAGVRN